MSGIERLRKLKYGKYLEKFFSKMFPVEWADDPELLITIWEDQAATLEQLDEDMQKGVNMGYSPEKQMEIVLQVIERGKELQTNLDPNRVLH